MRLASNLKITPQQTKRSTQEACPRPAEPDPNGQVHKEYHDPVAAVFELGIEDELEEPSKMNVCTSDYSFAIVL
jgi:hypothetical protein